MKSSFCVQGTRKEVTKKQGREGRGEGGKEEKDAPLSRTAKHFSAVIKALNHHVPGA